MPVKDGDRVYFKIQNGTVRTGKYDVKTKMVMLAGGKKAKPPKKALFHTRASAEKNAFMGVGNPNPELGAAPKKKTPKLSRAQYLGTNFSWSVFWSKNGAAGLKDYSSMPERIFHAAFKTKDDATDKKRRNSIFSKLQQLIGDGNMSDGTTWKTITKKDVEKIIK
tara:strand:+ start:615 stop:1109 length:495 start_codon:yes stop_codon:yes gene_type:complete